MVMQIRPPNVWLDANGNPAVDFQVYVALPNSDPKDPAKQLALTDSASGEVVSNPFTINPEGYPKNNNGQVVLPVIQEQEYSVLMVSKYGGIQYPYPSVKSDAFGIVGGGSGVAMVDAVYNNFPAAQSDDLTDFRLIFIQSKTSGWEGTASGPSYPYYSAYTGGVGPAGTGTFDLFYDSQGNEWKITENSQLPLTNEADIATNAAAIAVNVIAIAGNAADIVAADELTREMLLSNWSAAEVDAANIYSGSTFGLNTFVCVGGAGGVSPIIKTSLRGDVWTSRTPAGSDDLKGVTNNGITFVAAGDNGSVVTSPDSITWTDRPNGMTSSLRVAFGVGLFVAVGSINGARGEIWSSPDGVTWTERLAGPGIGSDLFQVIFEGGQFVAVGGGGAGGLIRTSPDGITWTLRTSPVEIVSTYNGVTYGNGTYYAVEDGNMVSSLDGITWSFIGTLPYGINGFDIGYGFGSVVINGTNGIMTSLDGVSWAVRSELTVGKGSQSIYFSNGILLAMAGDTIFSSLRAWSGA